MAHFSSLSSPESDDSTVEDIISRAIDHSTLEQIAALNLSLVSDSVLPTDLESRFRKLKSFPEASHELRNPHPSVNSDKEWRSRSLPPSVNPEKEWRPRSPNQYGKTPISSPDQQSDSESHSFSVESPKPAAPSQKTPLKSFNGSRGLNPATEDEDFIPVKSNVMNEGNPKSPSGSLSLPSFSSDSSIQAAASPPQQTCCFWYSPKRGSSKKKSKDDKVAGLDLSDLDLDLDNGHWGKDEFLTHTSSFSLKVHQRRMKKVLKEEEKMIDREAKKVLKWAKQVSARIDASSTKDSPSTDESFK